VEFLEALVRHIRGPLPLVWDGLPAQRRAVWSANISPGRPDGSRRSGDATRTPCKTRGCDSKSAIHDFGSP
jgi:hypothetical protein